MEHRNQHAHPRTFAASHHLSVCTVDIVSIGPPGPPGPRGYTGHGRCLCSVHLFDLKSMRKHHQTCYFYIEHKSHGLGPILGCFSLRCQRRIFDCEKAVELADAMLQLVTDSICKGYVDCNTFYLGWCYWACPFMSSHDAGLWSQLA